MKTPPRHIVLIGAGHAHIEVLRRFAQKPLADVRLTLIAKSESMVYSGLLPGCLAGQFSAEAMRIPLAPLARLADCTLVLGEATGLNVRKRSVRLHDGRAIDGDVISIDCGGRTGAPAPRDDIIPVKPIDDFAHRIERALSESPSRIAIVGSGAAGVELALSVRHRLRTAAVTLVAGPTGILPDFPSAVRDRFTRILKNRGVDIRASDGRGEADTRSIWATGIVPFAWLSASGLALDKDGFLAVDRHLRSFSHPGIFVAGDAAGMVETPRAKAGVIAVRQGPVLADNLRRYCLDRPLRPFVPQRFWLSLISTGDRYAVAVWGRLSVAGVWVWYWKRWIDRRFMRKYASGLPPRPP